MGTYQKLRLRLFSPSIRNCLPERSRSLASFNSQSSDERSNLPFRIMQSNPSIPCRGFVASSVRKYARLSNQISSNSGACAFVSTARAESQKLPWQQSAECSPCFGRRFYGGGRNVRNLEHKSGTRIVRSAESNTLHLKKYLPPPIAQRPIKASGIGSDMVDADMINDLRRARLDTRP